MSRPHPIVHQHIANKKKPSTFDNVIMIAAITYPVTGMPQVIDVFSGNIEGVSLTSWLSFTLFSALFLVYGIVYKLKPIIITDALWLVVNGLVVIGILIKT